MQQFVVDTSIIIKWLSNHHEDNIEAANILLDNALEAKIELLAPELAKYEVGNVLLSGKKLSSRQGITVLAQFYTLPITFIAESEDLSSDSFTFASTLGITYYDASFLSVAKRYDATLITDNIKHQGKTQDIKVISLKDINLIFV